MVQASWPSPNHNSRSVTDAEFGHLAPWASDGIFQSSTDPVYANGSGMVVHVRPEKYGIVQGHTWYSGTLEFDLTIGGNSSGSTRVDTVVLRLDRSTWDVTAAVHQGTAGAGAPALTRDTGDTGVWEIPVANVTVDNGVASIAANKVTMRPMLQAGALRKVNVITDVQNLLQAGDALYESSTGKWWGWNGSSADLIAYDTGTISLPIGYSTWTATSPGLLGRRVGNTVSLTLSVIRQKSTFSKSDPDGSVIAGPIDTRLRPPSHPEYGVGQFTTGASVRIGVDTDGTVSVSHASNDVPVNSYLRATVTYLV